ncbi:hypothetical protein M5689_017389 [Euphorbia peplus]|nr:hypothetical protein M5689_017389 [Euphorbia peplus]
MGSLIKNLAQKSCPALRFIAASKPPQLCDPLFGTSSAFTNNSNPLLFNNLIPQNPTKPSQFYYPSFPFSPIFNPVSVAGSDQLNAVNAAATGNCSEDDARTMWADSVKKKRKKKMNKHKYKKLRKRLRRKT